MGRTTTLDDALRLFEMVRMPARNLSVYMHEESATDLQDLIVFLTLQDSGNISDVSLVDLEQHQAEMGRRGYKVNIRERMTYAIESIFGF